MYFISFIFSKNISDGQFFTNLSFADIHCSCCYRHAKKEWPNTRKHTYEDTYNKNKKTKTGKQKGKYKKEKGRGGVDNSVTNKTSRPYKTPLRHVSKRLLSILLLCSTSSGEEASSFKSMSNIRHLLDS